MPMRLRRFARRGQHGVALFVGLMFLIVLSLIAVIAMRGTLMEMHMVNNVALHERAFEVSESLRGVPTALFVENTFNRGWPASKSGTLPDATFGTFPKGCSSGGTSIGSNGISCQTLNNTTIRSVGGAPMNFYEAAFNTGETAYDPTSWMTASPDVTVTACLNSDCSANYGTAKIWIRPDGTSLLAGDGTAQAAGYRGTGNAAAAGGGAKFFEVFSVGAVSSARATTMSQYQQSINN